MGEITSKDDNNIKIGFGLWVTLCFFICIWFIKSFTKGRKQFQSNLNVIEDGLKKMQEEMESKQQESIECEGPEDLDKFLERLEKEEEERERRMNRNKPPKITETLENKETALTETIGGKEMTEDTEEEKKNV